MNTKSTLTELFKRFPGIGQKQAERFAHFIARADPRYIDDLQRHITNAKNNLKECDKCFILHEDNGKTCQRCAIDADILIIVEKDVDVYSIENTIQETKHFFVLGRLFPIVEENIPQKVLILLEKIKNEKPKEIIIALSIHPDAEHTTQLIKSKIQQQLSTTQQKALITTLGRGLSSGSEIEYADSETIDNAFKTRTQL